MSLSEAITHEGDVLFLVGRAYHPTKTGEGNPWHDPQTGKFTDGPPGLNILKGRDVLRGLGNTTRNFIDTRRSYTRPDAIAAHSAGGDNVRIQFFRSGRVADEFTVPREMAVPEQQRPSPKEAPQAGAQTPKAPEASAGPKPIDARRQVISDLVDGLDSLKRTESVNFPGGGEAGPETAMDVWRREKLDMSDDPLWRHMLEKEWDRQDKIFRQLAPPRVPDEGRTESTVPLESITDETPEVRRLATTVNWLVPWGDDRRLFKQGDTLIVRVNYQKPSWLSAGGIGEEPGRRESMEQWGQKKYSYDQLLREYGFSDVQVWVNDQPEDAVPLEQDPDFIEGMKRLQDYTNFGAAGVNRYLRGVDSYYAGPHTRLQDQGNEGFTETTAYWMERLIDKSPVQGQHTVWRGVKSNFLEGILGRERSHVFRSEGSRQIWERELARPGGPLNRRSTFEEGIASHLSRARDKKGLAELGRELKGKTFVDWGFPSASNDRDTGIEFTKDDRILLRFDLKDGDPAMDISRFSHLSEEEVLLQRGQEWEITGGRVTTAPSAALAVKGDVPVLELHVRRKRDARDEPSLSDLPEGLIETPRDAQSSTGDEVFEDEQGEYTIDPETGYKVRVLPEDRRLHPTFVRKRGARRRGYRGGTTGKKAGGARAVTKPHQHHMVIPRGGGGTESVTFPQRFTQRWIEETLPQLNFEDFSQVIYELKVHRNWTNDELRKRVMPHISEEVRQRFESGGLTPPLPKLPEPEGGNKVRVDTLFEGQEFEYDGGIWKVQRTVTVGGAPTHISAENQVTGEVRYLKLDTQVTVQIEEVPVGDLKPGDMFEWGEERWQVLPVGERMRTVVYARNLGDGREVPLNKKEIVRRINESVTPEPVTHASQKLQQAWHAADVRVRYYERSADPNLNENMRRSWESRRAELERQAMTVDDLAMPGPPRGKFDGEYMGRLTDNSFKQLNKARGYNVSSGDRNMVEMELVSGLIQESGRGGVDWSDHPDPGLSVEELGPTLYGDASWGGHIRYAAGLDKRLQTMAEFLGDPRWDEGGEWGHARRNVDIDDYHALQVLYHEAEHVALRPELRNTLRDEYQTPHGRFLEEGMVESLSRQRTLRVLEGMRADLAPRTLDPLASGGLQEIHLAYPREHEWMMTNFIAPLRAKFVSDGMDEREAEDRAFELLKDVHSSSGFTVDRARAMHNVLRRETGTGLTRQQVIEVPGLFNDIDFELDVKDEVTGALQRALANLHDSVRAPAGVMTLARTLLGTERMHQIMADLGIRDSEDLKDPAKMRMFIATVLNAATGGQVT